MLRKPMMTMKRGASLFFALLAALAASNAQAEGQTLGRAETLHCDTAEQVRQAVAIFERGENGIEAVNKEKPAACSQGLIVFFVGEKVGSIAFDDGVYGLYRVKVVAFAVGPVMMSVGGGFEQVAVLRLSGDKPGLTEI